MGGELCTTSAVVQACTPTSIGQTSHDSLMHEGWRCFWLLCKRASHINHMLTTGPCSIGLRTPTTTTSPGVTENAPPLPQTLMAEGVVLRLVGEKLRRPATGSARLPIAHRRDRLHDRLP